MHIDTPRAALLVIDTPDKGLPAIRRPEWLLDTCPWLLGAARRPRDAHSPLWKDVRREFLRRAAVCL